MAQVSRPSELTQVRRCAAFGILRVSRAERAAGKVNMGSAAVAHAMRQGWIPCAALVGSRACAQRGDFYRCCLSRVSWSYSPPGCLRHSSASRRPCLRSGDRRSLRTAVRTRNFGTDDGARRRISALAAATARTAGSPHSLRRMRRACACQAARSKAQRLRAARSHTCARPRPYGSPLRAPR